MGNRALSWRSNKTAESSFFDAGSVDPIQDYTILILGCGDSGKTTLLNRWRLDDSHKKGHAERDQQERHFSVLTTIKDSFCDLVQVTLTQSGDLLSTDVKKLAEKVLPQQMKKFTRLPIPSELCSTMKKLWADEHVQKIWANKEKYGITSTLDYFCNELDRFSDSHFELLDGDFLRVKARTTGVISEEIVVESQHRVRVLDVGGQRCERRKWKNCFSEVDVVVFVVNAAEYDQNLFEDLDSNRLKESLKVFEQYANDETLRHANFVLLFNKTDVLEEKLSHKKGAKLKDLFPSDVAPLLRIDDSSKSASTANVLDVLKKTFLSLNKSKVTVTSLNVNALDDLHYQSIRQELGRVLNIE